MARDEDLKIPDSISPLLNEVAECLWSEQAAVMIGAGFSRNASSDFPDWNDLGDVFYERTHGKAPGSESKYLNVLKLADEMQAAFGRPALNQVIREAVPDLEHKPSSLHVDLLNLPWIDVFTTNYDTLLERACASVISRKYDIVVNQGDLVHSKKPRIIKLHGSFQSHRPFIITEDDYRRYPRDFVAFVNTVRQTLLENTLCLIGFSGDDPNFFQWVGWIRDNLDSNNSRRIYLIGVLNLSAAQERLLEQRNITLVNMSACEDLGKDDHEKGLDRFIRYVLSRKKDKGFKWPRREHSARLDSESAEKLRSPDLNEDIRDQINRVVAEWRKQRLCYPGWQILPEYLHDYLWTGTWRWINYAVSCEDLAEFLDLELAFELNWRLEKCLCPLFSEQIGFFESVLERYWNPQNWNSKGKDIAAMCIDLQLSVMRFYREEGQQEKWKGADAKIGSVFKFMSSEQKATWHHERSLSALFELDMQKLGDRMKEWEADESLPFFETKRASLLAETGQVHEAEKILKQSLETIRAQSNIKPVNMDYSLVSQEAIIIVLLQYVQRARLGSEGKPWDELEIWEELSERRDVLKQHMCDPWNEIKIFRERLSRPAVEKPPFTEKQAFDIGQVTQTINIGGYDEEILAAYRFLRFCEDTAIPLRILNVSFQKKPAKEALSRIHKRSSFWAMVTLVRMGEQKAVDHIFNRESLARMNMDTVDDLIGKYLEALESRSKEIRQGGNFSPDNLGKILAKVLPEILSRLCCKCSLSAKHRLIHFLLEVYKSPYRENYDDTKTLMRRLMASFTMHQQLDLIPELLDFPFTRSYELIAPNPFDFLYIDKKPAEDWARPAIPAEKIDALLAQGLSADRSARQWAIFTLGHLHFLDLLTQDQRRRFADVLWNKLDDTGFPDQTYNQGHFHRIAFAALPHPHDVNPVSLFKNYIFNAEFHKEPAKPTVSTENVHRAERIRRDIHSRNDTVRAYDNTVSVFRDIVQAKDIEWSDEDIKSMFQKIVECWGTEKDSLSAEDSTSASYGLIGAQLRPKFEAMVEVLVFVVAPNFDPSPENKDRKRLLRLIGEFRDYDLPTLRLEAACLHLYPDSADQLFDKTENGLTSDVDKTVVDSLGAVLTMVTDHFNDKRNSEALSHLVDMLGQMIFWRKKTVLYATIKVVKEAVKARPSLISGGFEKSVLTGLGNIADNTVMNTENSNLSEALHIRERAAGLAYKLFTFYIKQKKAVPDVIKRWQAICGSDTEFSEIRNQWITENQDEDCPTDENF